MKNYQQKRIDAIAYAEKSNHGYLRRIRVRDYLCGQAIYNLGDYPLFVSAKPTEYDKQLIKELAEIGVELIQLHEEWNDPLRVNGGDKFTSPDKDGLKEFVSLCHENGIKIIAYASTGYFQVTDPEYKEEFSRNHEVWDFNCYSYVKGCHGYAGWRDLILPKMLNVMDEYGFDGLFNDWGYDNHESSACILKPDAYDPEVEDFLSQIYGEIKKRGGIYKLHCDRNNKPPCRDKVCDYLWIGEFVDSDSVGIGKDYPMYVVPCQDRHFHEDADVEEYFAQTVPFMQFPLLKTGRPIRGKNGNVDGIKYFGGDEWEFYKSVGEYMDTHPDGPYVYSLWSSIPDDVNEHALWKKYMALYKPMVSENSLAYIELTSSDAILSPFGNGITASMFVNDEVYMVVSNFGNGQYTLRLDGKWKNRVTNEISDTFTVDKNKIVFLVKAE